MSADLIDDDTERGGRRGERRDGQTRPLRKRHIPFVGPLFVGLVVLPVVETIGWLIGLWDQDTGLLIAWGWVVTGALIGVIAACIGAFVRKRMTFLVGHVVATAFLAGSAAGLTTALGWSKVWGVIHFFGSLLLAGSWALYRIDVFRAAATGASSDGWGGVIGLAKSRPRKVTHDDAHVYIEVEHGPGETHDSVKAAAKKLESAVGAIGGRTIVTPGDRADTSKVALAIAHAFADWRNFPGLSHPGATFAAPFRTAYYATGKDQWFSFAATVGYDSPLTKFVAEMDAFIGATGTTGAGKSGFLNNACAEGLSRVDAIVCWLDKEKLLQNAGWALDMLGMAGNADNGRSFNRALRKLADYRVEVFGQVALDAVLDPDDPGSDIGRKWTAELARQTGEAAVLVIVDEADTAVQSKDWDWLAKRARSLGIFLLPATPRASAAEVPAAVRNAIKVWKTFSVGDNYSEGFTLSAETVDAGANPKAFSDPGLHYLDNAPGVDPRMYPVPAREFKSSTKVLRRMVKDARATFNPAVFSAGAIEAMGEDYEACRPDRVMGVRSPAAAADEAEAAAERFDAEQTQPLGQIEALLIGVANGAVQATPAEVEQARRILAANDVPLPPVAGERPDRYADDDVDEDGDPREENDMQATADGSSVEEDEVATVDQAAVTDVETARELAGIDPRTPVSTAIPGGAPPVRFGSDKPVWTTEQTEADLDRVLIEFAQRGKMSFTNQDAIEALTCEMREVTVSRRLNALAEDARISPPGLKVEREGRGRFRLVKRPQPRGRG